MIMVRDWSTCAWSTTSVRHSLDFLIRLVGCVLNKQLEDLRLADERGHYTTTWNIIHSLSGRNIKTNVKVKLRNGDPPENDEHLLEEWNNYFSSLLNNDSGFTPSELPLPASDDLPICTDPPTREETAEAIAAMKTNKAAGLDCAITAEALQRGGDQMIDTIHAFCSEVYTNMSPPKQWVSNVTTEKGSSVSNDKLQRNNSNVNCCQGL